MSSSVKDTHWPQTSQSSSVAPSRCTIGEDCTPCDPTAAMWRVQLLNGIKPTPFSNNPADFPFFQQQIQTHLESDSLTDAQRVEYLPKFETGEALEVVKRNRGCSFRDIMKTLEERFGQAMRVTQECVEDLTPALSWPTETMLENLNAASRILHGDVERKASVATILKRIVNRLQNENYEILKRGKTARLKDIAAFVKKQASNRKDPVFGIQTLRRDIKDTKPPSKPMRDQHLPIRNPTINVSDVGSLRELCGMCKTKRHKLQHCPIVKQCDHVAVRRQYAASCGRRFNCGLERPGHGSGSCPDPPACSKCPGRHLTLLHTESNDSSRRPSTRNNVNLNDKRVKSLDTAPLVDRKEENRGQNTGNSDIKSGPTPISSAGIVTAQAQVLLNVEPATITADNCNPVSTYAFLDGGCTDTLIDRELAEYLGLKGSPEQIGIRAITDCENFLESNQVSFTLRSADGSGEDIHVTDEYVLPDLYQSQRILPEDIDVWRYSHLQDIEFPAVDIKRVSIQ